MENFRARGVIEVVLFLASVPFGYGAPFTQSGIRCELALNGYDLPPMNYVYGYRVC